MVMMTVQVGTNNVLSKCQVCSSSPLQPQSELKVCLSEGRLDFDAKKMLQELKFKASLLYRSVWIIDLVLEQ